MHGYEKKEVVIDDGQMVIGYHTRRIALSREAIAAHQRSIEWHVAEINKVRQAAPAVANGA